MTSPYLSMDLPTVDADLDTWGTKLLTAMALIDSAFGVRFSATNLAGGAQTITSATATKVTFGTELYDVGAAFTSSKHTPAVAGIYEYKATIIGSASGGGLLRGEVLLYKNGSVIAPLFQINGLSGTGSGITMSGSAEILLDADDYVEIYAIVTGTGTITLSGSAGNVCTFSGAFKHS